MSIQFDVGWFTVSGERPIEGSSAGCGRPKFRAGKRDRVRSTCLPLIESKVVATTKIVAKTATKPPIQIRLFRAAEKLRETVSDSPTMITVLKLRFCCHPVDLGWPNRIQAVAKVVCFPKLWSLCGFIEGRSSMIFVYRLYH